MNLGEESMNIMISLNKELENIKENQKKKRMLKLYQTSLDHNAMRLEINCEGKNCQNTNIWRLKNVLLNNKRVTEENKEEIKNYLETQWSKIYGT